MPLYNALATRCQGAAAYRSPIGTIYRVAGDATQLYLLAPVDAAWENVTRVSGIYHIDAFDQWQFVYFNGDVIATQVNDPPQFLTLDAGGTPHFADLDGGPPRARYATVAQNSFVVLGNIFSGGNGTIRSGSGGRPPAMRITGRRPAQRALRNFSRGIGICSATAGELQGFADNLVNADAVVFQEYQVRQMVYSGPPQVFAFLPVETAIGTAGPYSIVGNGGIAYYHRQDGFCAFDGTNSVPIGANRVDKTFFANCASPAQMIGAADPVNRMIWWAYSTVGNFLTTSYSGIIGSLIAGVQQYQH